LDYVSSLGFKAERRFIEAWNETSNYPPWIKSVRAATDIEDFLEETDAVIATIYGRSLRIQIKLGHVGKRRKQIYFHKHIVILQIKPEWPLHYIREKTLEAIKEYRIYLQDLDYRVQRRKRERQQGLSQTT